MGKEKEGREVLGRRGGKKPANLGVDDVWPLMVVSQERMVYVREKKTGSRRLPPFNRPNVSFPNQFRRSFLPRQIWRGKGSSATANLEETSFRAGVDSSE